MPNTNFQTIHQMDGAINSFVKQATGRDAVQNIDMEHITVAQNHYYEDVDISGRVVSFNAGAEGIPLEKCLVQIEPVQEGEGDPSPDNVRPITGWTGAKVTRTGKNLLNKSAGVPYNIQRFIKFGVNQYADIVPNKTIKLSAGTYTFSVSGANSTKYESFAIFDESNTRVVISYNDKGITFTLTETGFYYIAIAVSSQVFTSWDNYDLMLEFGPTATAYEPYQGQTYDIEFPTEAGTVYGGTLDVTTGELVVEYKYFTENGSASWSEATTGGNRWVLGGAVSDSKNLDTTGVCNFGKLDSSFIGDGIVVQSNGRINLCGSLYSAFASANALKTYLASNPLQLVYKLADPINYHLTLAEVKTLLGINNIWADTGDIEVKFKKIKEFF